MQIFIKLFRASIRLKNETFVKKNLALYSIITCQNSSASLIVRGGSWKLNPTKFTEKNTDVTSAYDDDQNLRPPKTI